MKKYRILLGVLCIGAAMVIPQIAFANPLPPPPGIRETLSQLMNFLAPFLLAILQGIAEFLPISSSGHLVLLNSLFHKDMGMFFDLVLHLATLVSVVAYYRRDIADICVNCVKEIGSGKEKKNWKFVGYLAAATAITGTIGLLLNDWVENGLRKVYLVGALLIANAGILWISRKKGLFSKKQEAGSPAPLERGPGGEAPVDAAPVDAAPVDAAKPAVQDSEAVASTLTLPMALILGLAQGLAVLPGISRSGTTITVALLMGIAPQNCAKISFLLSIPVILGAVVLHLRDFSSMSTDGIVNTAIAAVIAAIVGYVSLVVLNKVLKKANFHYFAPYCLLVGLAAVILGVFF